MKRPTWATAVGILGIIFGLFGILGSAQTALMPKMIEAQKAFLSGMSAPVAKPEQQAQMEQFKAMANGMFGEVPAWAPAACLFVGIAGALLNAVYVFAAIALLQVKRYSIRLFYSIIWLSIGFAIVRGLILSKAFSLMGASMAMGAIFGIVIDLILFVVILTSDKEAFSHEPAA